MLFQDGVTTYPDSPIYLAGLQELKDRVKLLLILRTTDQVLVAPGNSIYYFGSVPALYDFA